jgi:hypothetical protein
MKRRCSFDRFRVDYWPEPRQLEPYFFAPVGKEWFQNARNDGAILMDQAAYGTDDLPIGNGRINISLQLWGKPRLGVLLVYSRLGGRYADMFSSKGNMTRIREWVRSTHGDPLPIGLFIPFVPAYQAVKEFIETDGELPTPGAERSYPDVT